MDPEQAWNKFKALKERVLGLGRAAIAFSGGVDSLLLLYAARECGRGQVMAVTLDSCFFPRRELRMASALAAKLDLEHAIIKKDKFTDPLIMKNPRERCYFCKKELFGELKEVIAADYDITCLLEGSNADDLPAHRPGMGALEELGVLSPLREIGLAKDEIRFLLAAQGSPVWDLPPAACLATRVPQGQEITPDELKMIEKAEDYLLMRGLRQVRVRHHGEMARIEVAPEERTAFSTMGFMDEVAETLRRIGYEYVSLDLAGYRTVRLREEAL